MTAFIIGWVAGILVGFGLGHALTRWADHKGDGSSLPDLDKYSGRF